MPEKARAVTMSETIGLCNKSGVDCWLNSIVQLLIACNVLSPLLRHWYGVVRGPVGPLAQTSSSILHTTPSTLQFLIFTRVMQTSMVLTTFLELVGRVHSAALLGDRIVVPAAFRRTLSLNYKAAFPAGTQPYITL